MGGTSFTFSSIADNSFFTSLSEILKSTQKDDIIVLSPLAGSGIIKRKELQDGLLFFGWDFSTNENIRFFKEAKPKQDGVEFFSIIYLLNNANVLLSSPGLKEKFQLGKGKNILCISDAAELIYEVPAKQPVKAITISVSSEWLLRELSAMEKPFHDFLNHLLTKDNPSIFTESITFDEFRELTEILKYDVDKPENAVRQKAKIMTLLADLFLRIYHQPQTEDSPVKMLHYKKMQQVESILQSHLEENLPDMETIARNVALSVSTLKRYFKETFGKGIYEYYLELKMDHAKRLLIEKDLSVNQVANILHYEKVSSFIDMFKKHHGNSPGAFRKKII